MPQAARYLFDLDFSAPPQPEVEEPVEVAPPEPMITVAEHERLLARVREQAFAEGEKKGLDQRKKLASEEQIELQQKILNDISMVYTEVGALLGRLERDASKLAFTFASRFAEKLVAQEPKTEIMALLHQVLAPLRETPHIAIRINDAVANDIAKLVDQQMGELGFTGQLNIIPDPTTMPGDCEVEWVDGGIGRNLRSAIRQVDDLLEEHFAHIPPEEEPENGSEEAAAKSDSQKDDQTGNTEANSEDGFEAEREPSTETEIPAQPPHQAAQLDQTATMEKPEAAAKPAPAPSTEGLARSQQPAELAATDGETQ